MYMCVSLWSRRHDEDLISLIYWFHFNWKNVKFCFLSLSFGFIFSMRFSFYGFFFVCLCVLNFWSGCFDNNNVVHHWAAVWFIFIGFRFNLIERFLFRNVVVSMDDFWSVWSTYRVHNVNMEFYLPNSIQDRLIKIHISFAWLDCFLFCFFFCFSFSVLWMWIVNPFHCVLTI